ncbi:MAG: type I-C CRISPR-associated protein Cas8c/Csd1 [Gordonibacter pamelaeae]
MERLLHSSSLMPLTGKTPRTSWWQRPSTGFFLASSTGPACRVTSSKARPVEHRAPPPWSDGRFCRRNLWPARSSSGIVVSTTANRRKGSPWKTPRTCRSATSSLEGCSHTCATSRKGASTEPIRRTTVFTNAERYQERYVSRPASTLQMLMSRLRPHLNRLNAQGDGWCEKAMLEVMDELAPEDMTNKALGPVYLIGYASQYNALRSPKGTTHESTGEDEPVAEGDLRYELCESSLCFETIAIRRES